MKNLKLYLSESERTFIIAALMAYDASTFAKEINERFVDVADDGPEVAILSVDRNAQ